MSHSKPIVITTSLASVYHIIVYIHRSGCELRTSEKKIPVDKPQFNCEKIKLQKQTVAQAKEDREQVHVH